MYSFSEVIISYFPVASFISLEFMLNITNEERIKNLIVPLLRKYTEQYYEQYKTLLRKAVSYTDKVLYAKYII